jgi:D-3-phosphoglycerate dehydrogenase
VKRLLELYPDAKVNTAGVPCSRRIIDEVALKARLKSRRIAAAAIDASAIELPTDDELLNLTNFIATPHIGAGAEEARWLMGITAIEGLVDNFLPTPGAFPFEDA